MTTAFQQNAFQNNAFQIETLQFLTDTKKIQLPINCVLGDGTHELEIGPMFRERNAPSYKMSVKVSFGGGGRIGEASTFTTKTGNKGYD